MRDCKVLHLLFLPQPNIKHLHSLVLSLPKVVRWNERLQGVSLLLFLPKPNTQHLHSLILPLPTLVLSLPNRESIPRQTSQGRERHNHTTFPPLNIFPHTHQVTVCSRKYVIPNTDNRVKNAEAERHRGTEAQRHRGTQCHLCSSVLICGRSHYPNLV